MTDEADNTADPDEVDAPPEPSTRFGALLTDSTGQVVLHPTRDSWLEVAEAAKADGFDHLTTVTAVDFLTFRAPRDLPDGITAERFEVVAIMSSMATSERIRMRVQVPDSDPTLPTLFDIWPGSEALEREVYDMFGIDFTDHPDMCRILMPDDWVGHPLRKDYDVGAIPVQFKDEGAIR